MKHLFSLLSFGLLALTLLYFANNSPVKAEDKSINIVNSYIVVLKDDVADPGSAANEMAKSHGFSIKHVYKNALKGYSAVIPPQAVAGVKHDPKVKYIVSDQLVSAEAPKKPVGKPSPRPTNTPTPSPTATPTPSPTPIPTPVPTPTPTPSPRFATITFPNGGETFTVGNTVKVTWNLNDVDTCYLGYSFGPGSLNDIATINNPTTGYYNWVVNIGNMLPGSSRQVKLDMLCYKTGVGSVSDQSDNFFTVTDPSSPTPTPTPSPSPTPTPTPIPSPAPQIIPTGLSRIGINNNKGAGIGVAVIDSGIDLTHPDLAGNIIANTNCIDPTKDGNDDNGHGSHVAGTIAALDNNIGVRGVAPEAKIIAVKVLAADNYGTWSSVICGIDYVTAHAAEYNIKIANMSLGGGGMNDNNCGLTDNDPVHQAICNSRDQGVTYVVSAGNNNANAGLKIPAAYDDAVITVSALVDTDGKSGGLGTSVYDGPDDTFASFSNWGPVVDIGAPGVHIYSTWKNGGYGTASGTSMATPHVSGSALLYIQSHPGSTWQQVRDGLINAGEVLNAGHTDPSGLHPEPVVKINTL